MQTYIATLLVSTTRILIEHPSRDHLCSAAIGDESTSSPAVPFKSIDSLVNPWLLRSIVFGTTLLHTGIRCPHHNCREIGQSRFSPSHERYECAYRSGVNFTRPS